MADLGLGEPVPELNPSMVGGLGEVVAARAVPAPSGTPTQASMTDSTASPFRCENMSVSLWRVCDISKRGDWRLLLTPNTGRNMHFRVEDVPFR